VTGTKIRVFQQYRRIAVVDRILFDRRLSPDTVEKVAVRPRWGMFAIAQGLELKRPAAPQAAMIGVGRGISLASFRAPVAYAQRVSRRDKCRPRADCK
jgi:hypothetical protein